MREIEPKETVSHRKTIYIKLKIRYEKSKKTSNRVFIYSLYLFLQVFIEVGNTDRIAENQNNCLIRRRSYNGEKETLNHNAKDTTH